MSATMSDAIIANTILIAIGWNNFPSTPSKVNKGAKTTIIISTIDNSYKKILNIVLNTRKNVVLIAVILFIGSLSLLPFSFHTFQSKQRCKNDNNN
jgi:Cu/Ag efflux pump CusA